MAAISDLSYPARDKRRKWFDKMRDEADQDERNAKVVKIKFSFHGHRYESGLAIIERTYTAALKVLLDQKRNCYAQFEGLRKGEIIDDFDPEDGEYSKFDYLDFEVNQIEFSVQLLRQSILLMIYHFWEKQVITWAGKKLRARADPSAPAASSCKSCNKAPKEPLHNAYVRHCQEKEKLNVDIPRMDELNLIVNFVKHGTDWKEFGVPNDTAGSKQKKLFLTKPDIWKSDVQSSDPFDFLHIEDEHIAEYLTAVRASGPSRDSNFHPSMARNKVSTS